MLPWKASNVAAETHAVGNLRCSKENCPDSTNGVGGGVIVSDRALLPPPRF